jgi:hypothetical protein
MRAVGGDYGRFLALVANLDTAGEPFAAVSP